MRNRVAIRVITLFLLSVLFITEFDLSINTVTAHPNIPWNWDFFYVMKSEQGLKTHDNDKSACHTWAKKHGKKFNSSFGSGKECPGNGSASCPCPKDDPCYVYNTDRKVTEYCGGHAFGDQGSMKESVVSDWGDEYKDVKTLKSQCISKVTNNLVEFKQQYAGEAKALEWEARIKKKFNSRLGKMWVFHDNDGKLQKWYKAFMPTIKKRVKNKTGKIKTDQTKTYTISTPRVDSNGKFTGPDGKKHTLPHTWQTTWVSKGEKITAVNTRILSESTTTEWGSPIDIPTNFGYALHMYRAPKGTYSTSPWFDGDVGCLPTNFDDIHGEDDFAYSKSTATKPDPIDPEDALNLVDAFSTEVENDTEDATEDTEADDADPVIDDNDESEGADDGVISFDEMWEPYVKYFGKVPSPSAPSPEGAPTVNVPYPSPNGKSTVNVSDIQNEYHDEYGDNWQPSSDNHFMYHDESYRTVFEDSWAYWYETHQPYTTYKVTTTATDTTHTDRGATAKYTKKFGSMTFTEYSKGGKKVSNKGDISKTKKSNVSTYFKIKRTICTKCK